MESQNMQQLFGMFDNFFDCVMAIDDAEVLMSNRACNEFFLTDCKGRRISTLFDYELLSRIFKTGQGEEGFSGTISGQPCDIYVSPVFSNWFIHFRPKAGHEKSRTLSYEPFARAVRGPLSIIFSSLDLLSSRIDRDPGSKVDDYIAHINRSGHQLLKFTNNVIDSLSYNAKSLRCEPRNSDIIALLQDVSNSFVNVESVDITLEKAVSSHIISFDRLKIERVLYNMLSCMVAYPAEEDAVSRLLIRVSVSPELVCIAVKNLDPETNRRITGMVREAYGRFRKELAISEDIGLMLSFAILDLHSAQFTINAAEEIQICLPNASLGETYLETPRLGEISGGFSAKLVELSDMLPFSRYRKSPPAAAGRTPMEDAGEDEK